jgi:polar amino acid transport system substrate-binding protein
MDTFGMRKLIGRKGGKLDRVTLVVAGFVLVFATACGTSDGDGSSEETSAPTETSAPGGEVASYGQCEISTEPNQITLETEKPETLIVGYTAIAPATYDGDTEESVDDGFNYCLAANIANAAGLPNIELEKVDFAQLIVAGESGFDVAIDDFYIRPERQEKVDFSIPYGASWSGVVVRADDVPTEDEFEDLKMGVTLGSAQQILLDEEIHPTQQYNTYDNPPEMFAALEARQIDAALIDMPVALAASAANEALETIAQIKAGGEVGIIMVKDGPNTDPVSSVVQQMLDSGAIHEMEERYYFDAFGGVDPGTLPQWGPLWDN